MQPKVTTTQTFLAKFIVPAVITLSSILALSACGGGGLQASSFSSNVNGQATSPLTSAPLPSAFQQLDYTGYVSGGTYDNNYSVSLDKANNAVIMNLPIPAGTFSNTYLDIPNLQGAKIKTYYDSNNRPQVAVSIPLNYILHGVTTLPSTSLPNGSPLPAMPAGALPSLALSLNQNPDNKVYLYIGVNAVGLYLESSYIPSYLGMTFPIKNKMQTQILGYFSVIPKTTNFNGGLFCSLQIPNEIAKIIDDHMSGLIK